MIIAYQNQLRVWLKKNVDPAVMVILWLICFPLQSFGYPNQVQHVIELDHVGTDLVFHPQGRYLYVLNPTHHEVVTIDLLLRQPVARVAVSGQPRSLSLSLDGQSLYVVSDRLGYIEALQLADPRRPAVDQDYAIGSNGRSLNELLSVSRSNSEFLIVASWQDAKLFFASRQAGDISMIDNSPLSLLANARSMATVFDNFGGTRLFVLHQGGVLQQWLLSSLSQVGSVLDLSVFSAEENFSQVRTFSVNGQNYVFALNASSQQPGVYVVALQPSSYNLSLRDAAPSDGSVMSPIIVGDEPVSILAAEAPRVSGSSQNDAGSLLYVGHASGHGLKVFDLAGLSTGSDIANLVNVVDLGAIQARGMVTSASGDRVYLVNNDAHGQIFEISDQPVITLGASSTTIDTDQDVSLTLESTQAGSVTIRQYPSTESSIKNTAGLLLDSAALSANSPVRRTISTATFVEGQNHLLAFLSAGSYRSWAGLNIVKDTVPPTPRRFTVAFGDGKIVIKWQSNGEEDISHYLLSWGLSSLAVDGSSALSSPINIAHGQPNVHMTYHLQPLANGITVYAKLAAVDLSGNVSPYTEILQQIPEVTVGPLSVSGDQGCRLSGSLLENSGLFILLALLVLGHVSVGCRRVYSVLCVLCVSGACLMMSKPALADDSWSSYTVALGVTWWFADDKALTQFFGEEAYPVLTLRTSRTWGLLDLGLSSGFGYQSGHLLGRDTGRVSGEASRLVMITNEVFFALSPFDKLNWMILPIGQISYGFVHYRVRESSVVVWGLKQSIVVSAGIRILLNRWLLSSDPEDVGVDDVFLDLCPSYRKSFASGIDFGGWQVESRLGFSF